jgi:hypothetical protein
MNKILIEKLRELKTIHKHVSLVLAMRKLRITKDKAQQLLKIIND